MKRESLVHIVVHALNYLSYQACMQYPTVLENMRRYPSWVCTKILKYLKMYWRTCRYAELVAAHTTAKGTGKTRNEERRNGKREMKKWAFNCMPSLHSATPGADFCRRSQQSRSRDYSISLIHKGIIDCPECCSCVTSHHTGQAELFVGSTSQQSSCSRLARVFKTPATCF